ncbi:MAG: GGDEF domain-containing protein [bacterium]|nr:GGDEF domain-containing protein [bacterium]
MFSQEEEVLSWMEQVIEHLGKQPEETLAYCEKIRSYGEQTNNDKYLGFAHYYSGEAYYTLNNVEMVLLCIYKAIDCLERAGEWELMARAYNLEAIISESIGNASFAMDHYMNALVCCRKHQLIRFETIILLNIGTLYYNYGEYDFAQDFFSRAIVLMNENDELKEQYFYRLISEIGLGRCALHRGDTENARQHAARIHRECAPYMNVENYTYYVFQVQLYHQMGNYEARDEYIKILQNSLDEQLPLMDFFDDFYEYAALLLDIEKIEEFQRLIDFLEMLAMRAKVTFLQRRIRELKIQYYQKRQDEAAVFHETAKFYEDTMKMENSNRAMILNMMNNRLELEEAREKREQMAAENEALTRKSETDALTTLYNRFCLTRMSREAFLRAAENHTSMAVEILDIDYFKQFNDNYGHQRGDECIHTVANELKTIAMNDGVNVFRYGGDEFVVTYENLPEQRVKEIAENLKNAITKQAMAHAFSPAAPYVTISQGICWDYPKESDTMEDYLHSADECLYEVKKHSRNSIAMTHFPYRKDSNLSHKR